MKTVSGKFISSKPLSLSQASKILSRFVTIDNGASPAVGVYLRRASEAFDELNQFHKEVKARRSERTNKKPDSAKPPNQTIKLQSGNHEDLERETKKNKKGKKVGDGVTSQTGQSGGDVVTEIRSGLELANGGHKFSEMDNEKKHRSKKHGRAIEDADGEPEEARRRKKRKSAEISEGGIEGGSVENHSKKSKRRKPDE